jgi:ribose transport system ATP-binding protein
MMQSGIPTQDARPVSTAPILRLEGISKTFASVAAVKSLSLEIGRHEVVGLIGENGAGKSTLLKMLTGVHLPDRGRMELNGRPVAFRGPLDATANGVGIVHQEQSLFTNLSVAENIIMAAGAGSRAIRGGLYRWSVLRAEAEHVLASIGSSIDPDRLVGDLGFAERQMVEIARTIHTACQSAAAQGGAPLVILDEPTSVLEKAETDVLEAEISRLRGIGSVILVSHRLEEILRICDRVVVMRHGELVADRPKAEVTEADLYRLMIGKDRHARARGPVPPVPAGPPALRVAGLTRAGHFRDVDVDFHAGRVTAIVGTFGAGREALVRALFGVEGFDAGQIELDGNPVANWTPRRAIRAGMAYLPAERGVESAVGGLSAARNLTMVPLGKGAGWVLSAARRKSLAADWFERLDIRPRLPAQPLERFSGGNQQKVVLAKWLALSPRVLVLDHPLRGLDPGAGATVNACIRDACKAGAAVILLADTLEEALDLGHEVIVMRDGEITARFDMGRDDPTTLDLLEKMV